MKSEPDVFSIHDLRQKKVAAWDGVRNYQARNNLRAMRAGDLAFFFHSHANPPAVAGLMEIVGEAHPDPTAPEPALRASGAPGRRKPGDPGWDQVTVKFIKAFLNPLPLDAIRRISSLRRMVLVKNSRLSVQPVTPAEWKILMNLLDPR